MNSKKLSILVLIIILINSCCPYKLTKYDKQSWNKKIKSQISDLVIDTEKPINKFIDIPEINAEIVVFLGRYSFIRGDGVTNNSFTPTIQDIKNAEIKLTDYNKQNNIPYNDLERYNKRQYIGFYTKNNEKLLIINFLKIKDNCQKKSINNYLFDKYFLDLLHPNENEEKRRIYLKD